MQIHETLKIRFALFTSLVLILLSPTCAQSQMQQSPSGSNEIVLPAPPTPPMDDTRRAALAAYDPVIRLIAHVTLINKLAEASHLTFSRSQAQTLLPLFKELADRSDLKPAEAEETLTALRHTLTSEQLEAVEAAWRQRDEARRQAGAPTEMTLPDGRKARVDSSQPASPPEQLPLSQPNPAPGAGMDAAITEGRPFNPFNPNDMIAGKAVQNLIARLTQLST